MALSAVTTLAFLLCWPRDQAHSAQSARTAELNPAYQAAMDGTNALKWGWINHPVIIATDTTMTAEQALEAVVPASSALVVVTYGPSQPRRRNPQAPEPFLTTGQGVILPVDAINAAAGLVETVLGRPLFPFRVEAVSMEAYITQQQRDAGTSLRPYAVWEVGTGLLLVDRQLVSQSWATPKVLKMTELLADSVFSSIAKALANVAHIRLAELGLADLQGMLGLGLPAALAAAFAAAPPLWFCVLCPAVLGLLAPLVINIGLNQVAGYLCTHMSLPDDQCFDLLLGALGLGFVLSLASAIPIFFVCKLSECANHGGGQVNAGTTTDKTRRAGGWCGGKLRWLC